jgi:DeoR/GlpR family transcriptional regulator of sugar metabolism
VSVQKSRATRTSGSNRRELIAALVTEQGFCTVTELAQRLEVSEMTVRRDVSQLLEAGRIRTFHGGVSAVSPMEIVGTNYSERNDAYARQKRAVAERAAAEVQPASVIAIDAGTTMAHVAQLLRSTDSKMTAITASLPVVTALAPNSLVDLICLGGILHPESLSFAGPVTLAAIANLHIDMLFLAASGMGERGAFCGNGFDAITKRALIDAADRVVLVADSSKFSRTATVRICGWDAIDELIVDGGAQPDDLDRVRSAGVEVVIASSTDD